ncbi:unnamed protein product, partial [Urochloa humidicola]
HPIHEVSEGKECCPSPETGTQEAPAVESSQEIGDAEGVAIPNWGGQQEELQASVSITELVHELDTAEKEQDSSKTGGDTTSITTIDSQEVGIEGKRETTRQSERIKHQGDGNMKIAEKAEKAAAKKNLEGRWPMKYLGVPVSGTKLHIADWLFLDEKVLKRLEGWQGLQKPVDKIAMEQGAEALKESALFFHPCEA